MYMTTARPFESFQIHPIVNCAFQKRNGVDWLPQNGRSRIFDNFQFHGPRLSYRYVTKITPHVTICISFFVSHPHFNIDYRCDDKIKYKKLFSWADILVSLRSWRLQESKNAGHQPSSSTCSFTNSKKKNRSCMDCQSPTPTSQNSPIFINRSAD